MVCCKNFEFEIPISKVDHFYCQSFFPFPCFVNYFMALLLKYLCIETLKLKAGWNNKKKKKKSYLSSKKKKKITLTWAYVDL